MAVCLLIGIVLILVLPRAKAITPFLLTFFIIPTGQVIVLGGVHFTILRMLALVGLVKIALSPGRPAEGRYPGGFSGIDRAVVVWTILTLITFCLRFQEMQAWINGVGVFLENLGSYLVIRSLIPDREAVRRTLKTLAVLCVIESVPMIIEQFTHINIFGYFTGA